MRGFAHVRRLRRGSWDNMEPLACPDENILTEFAEASLEGDPARAIGEHLDSCDRCRRTGPRGLPGRLFASRLRNSGPAFRHYSMPIGRGIEIGLQYEV